MSRNMLEVMTTYLADGTTERHYRIGTADWVKINDYTETVQIELQDGKFIRRRPIKN